jgi:hypothetical protein
MASSTAAALASRRTVVGRATRSASSAGRQIVAAASPLNGDKTPVPKTRGPLRGGKQPLKAVIHPTDTPGGIGQLTPDMSPIVIHGKTTGVPITGVWQPETRCVLYTAELEQGSLYIGVDSTATQERPGNGGLRIRSYPTPAAAKQEAINLSEAMSFKHGVYNTGFSGAKLVFDTAVPVDDIDKEQLMDRVAEVLEVIVSIFSLLCPSFVCVNSAPSLFLILRIMSEHIFLLFFAYAMVLCTGTGCSRLHRLRHQHYRRRYGLPRQHFSLRACWNRFRGRH